MVCARASFKRLLTEAGTVSEPGTSKWEDQRHSILSGRLSGSEKSTISSCDGLPSGWPHAPSVAVPPMRPKRDAVTPPHELSTGERRGAVRHRDTRLGRPGHGSAMAALEHRGGGGALLTRYQSVTRQRTQAAPGLQQPRTCAGPRGSAGTQGLSAPAVPRSLRPPSRAQIPASSTSGGDSQEVVSQLKDTHRSRF